MALPQKPIYIIGAACTGKTTLVSALKDYCSRHTGHVTQPYVISEVARHVVKRLGIDREDIATSPSRCLILQEEILHAQYEVETSLRTWYISDRSGLDPIVYTCLFVGEDAATKLLNSNEWIAMEQKMKSGFVFLCQSGNPWLFDDGIRLLPKNHAEWARFDDLYLRLLEEREIEYTIIPSDLLDIFARTALVTQKALEDVELAIDVSSTNS